MGRPATLRIDILADASKASREMDGFGGKVGKFGAVAGAAVAGAAIAVGAFALKAVGAASDVQQAYGAADQIFGQFAGNVKRNAEGAARSVGLSQSSYTDLANVIGSQLKNAGTAMDQLAPKTDSLIGLGADLAATFGGTTADAVAAVSSLLKGERDPIERYGVSIKAADVSARMAAMGLSGLTGEAAKQAEAQATLALLTEQTSAAQGQFARESGSVAGQQQQLGAIWENLKATVGSGLLPVLTQAGAFMLDKVMPAGERLAATLRDDLGPAFARIGDFITTRVIPAAAAFGAWFMDKIAPGIRATVTPILNGLRGAFASVAGAVQQNEPQLRAILNVLRVVAEFIAGKVAPVVGAVLGGAFRFLGGYISSVVGGIGLLVSGIQNAVTWIQRLADKISNSGVGRALSGIAGAVGGIFSSRVSASGVTAARTLSAARLTAAAGLAGDGGISVAVAGPTVIVRIGERELSELVDVRVEHHGRALARRLAGKVR